MKKNEINKKMMAIEYRKKPRKVLTLGVRKKRIYYQNASYFLHI